jgi:spermidine/putrescine transport system permease protein
VKRGHLAAGLMWAFITLSVAFLYLPLIPPVLFSIGATTGEHGLTFAPYLRLWSNPILLRAIRTTVLSGIIVAAVTPALGLFAAFAVRELAIRRVILVLVLLPLFVPGVGLGLADAFFFRELGIQASLFTIVIVQVLWALPFATLIILTVMAGFDPIYLEAAYMSGANRLQAFRDIELPLIRAGVLGAASFSLILSFNETVRTSIVQGPLNTVQTYIWSTYRQVGLSPALYALMSLLIILTLLLVAIFLLAERINPPGAQDRQGRSVPT